MSLGDPERKGPKLSHRDWLRALASIAYPEDRCRVFIGAPTNPGELEEFRMAPFARVELTGRNGDKRTLRAPLSMVDNEDVGELIVLWRMDYARAITVRESNLVH